MANSTLPSKVQALIELICDVNMITSSLMEQGYDIQKLPLGKISHTMGAPPAPPGLALCVCPTARVPDNTARWVSPRGLQGPQGRRG